MSYYRDYYRFNTRKKRAMGQKMFLLNVLRNKDEWKFIVKGTTNDYDLLIDKSLISCSCPDFSQRGRICKHIYFIIGKIAQNGDLLSKLENEIENGSRESKLSDEEFNTLSNNLVQRLTQRLMDYGSKEEETDTIPNNVKEDDCPICYEPLNVGKLIQCCDGMEGHTCRNYFHNECINEWVVKAHSCPMCRRQWSLGTTNEKFDPFDKLDKIDIKID